MFCQLYSFVVVLYPHNFDSVYKDDQVDDYLAVMKMTTTTQCHNENIEPV